MLAIIPIVTLLLFLLLSLILHYIAVFKKDITVVKTSASLFRIFKFDQTIEKKPRKLSKWKKNG